MTDLSRHAFTAEFRKEAAKQVIDQQLTVSEAAKRLGMSANPPEGDPRPERRTGQDRQTAKCSGHERLNWPSCGRLSRISYFMTIRTMTCKLRKVIKQRHFDRSHAPVCGRGASGMGYHAGAWEPSKSMAVSWQRHATRSGAYFAQGERKNH